MDPDYFLLARYGFFALIALILLQQGTITETEFLALVGGVLLPTNHLIGKTFGVDNNGKSNETA